MKKLLFALLVSAVIMTNVDARSRFGRGCSPCGVSKYSTCEMPRCEKQEMITVCAEPEMVYGYKCPAGFEEVECD